MKHILVLSMRVSSLLEVQEEEKVRQDKECESHGIIHRFKTVVKDHESRQSLKEVSKTSACTVCANKLLWDRFDVADNS